MMYSNQKLAIDLLLSVFATFILTTTILSISTVNWHVDVQRQRTGLFQRCAPTCCCTWNELNRTITMLVIFSVLLLLISTISSFFLMTNTFDRRNRCYLFVPMALFGAGMSMTLSLVQIMDRLSINSYSAFIFLIDTVLTYVVAGIAIVHGSMFYFT